MLAGMVDDHNDCDATRRVVIKCHVEVRHEYAGLPRVQLARGKQFGNRRRQIVIHDKVPPYAIVSKATDPSVREYCDTTVSPRRSGGKASLCRRSTAS